MVFFQVALIIAKDEFDANVGISATALITIHVRYNHK